MPMRKVVFFNLRRLTYFFLFFLVTFGAISLEGAHGFNYKPDDSWTIYSWAESYCKDHNSKLYTNRLQELEAQIGHDNYIGSVNAAHKMALEFAQRARNYMIYSKGEAYYLAVKQFNEYIAIDKAIQLAFSVNSGGGAPDNSPQDIVPVFK